MTCKNCEKREIGCHGTCAEYIEWAKQKEKNDEAFKARANANRWYSYNREKYTRLNGPSKYKRRPEKEAKKVKHSIRITTAESMLINKALRADLQNEIDNKMASLLIDRINEVVAYDLEDNRCENCENYKQTQKRKGLCKKRSSSYWQDIRAGRTRACKRYFERRNTDGTLHN